MPLESRLLDNSFALEVMGLRLWERQDEQTIDALRALWARSHSHESLRSRALSAVLRERCSQFHSLAPAKKRCGLQRRGPIDKIVSEGDLKRLSDQAQVSRRPRPTKQSREH